MPYHWSWIGRVRGDAANDLIGFVADPNVHIQESKALTGNIVPGRRATSRRAAVPELPEMALLRDVPGMVPLEMQPKQNDPEKE
jgi:formate dehydrogenase major subunit